MKIVVCGSMSFYCQMLAVRDRLQADGHTVIIPELASRSHLRQIVRGVYRDTAELKIQYDFIRRHCRHIEAADAVLILNYDKNEVRNYIGGNTFLEIGFAHVLGKRIFLLNDIPRNEIYYDELVAMQPTVIYGDITKIERGDGNSDSARSGDAQRSNLEVVMRNAKANRPYEIR